MSPPAAAEALTPDQRVERVWRDLGGDLHRFISRRVRDPAAADDVLQDTFLKVHRGIDSLRDDERLAPWVFRIARNAIVDHARRHRAKPPDDTVEDRAPQSDDENVNDTVARWLRPMLQSLPEEYRVALELVELEGLTQTELAERLGISISGAKSRVQRGRVRLKRVLNDCCELQLDRRGNVIDYQPRTCCSDEDC